MIEDTIARIEARLKTAQNLPQDEREELQGLLNQLRAEAAGVEFPNRSFDTVAEEDAQGAIGLLEESLTEFETTHPRLVGVVNRISTMLSNMGI